MDGCCQVILNALTGVALLYFAGLSGGPGFCFRVVDFDPQGNPAWEVSDVNYLVTFRLLRCSLITVAAGIGGGIMTSPAGTPILFPNGNPPAFAASRLPPGQAIVFPGALISESLDREIRLRRKLGDPTAAPDALSQYRSAGNQTATATPRVDPRRLKQLQAERNKRQFWLFDESAGEPGTEATRADTHEEAYRKLENKSDKLDPAFKSALRDARQPATRSAAEWASYPDNAEPATATPTTEPQHGAHTSPELSLKELLAPLASVAPSASDAQTSLSLHGLLESSDGPASGRERTGQNHLGVLDLSGSPAASLGARDPINLSPDATRQPLQPMVGSPASALGPRTGFNPSAGSEMGARSASGSLFPAGGLNQGSSRIIGFSTLPPPVSIKPAAPQPPGWSPVGPDRELPRRRF